MGFFSALDLHTSKVYVPKPRVFYVGGYQAWATAYKYERWTGLETLERAFDSILRDLSYQHRSKIIELGTSIPLPVGREQTNAAASSLPSTNQAGGAVPSDPNDAFFEGMKGAHILRDWRPGHIIDVDDNDPRFPPRRNWFQRLLDRF